MGERKDQKGFRLEELLRAYFIRAGVYAVRGVPLKFDGDDLTDIDIWLYERPTGSSRRRQIVDAKSKTKPKAIERLLWTKGLFELLDVDGAYIATTDTRPLLKDMSRRLGISVLDGSDIKRMAESDKVVFPDRLAEEEIDDAIRRRDTDRRNKYLQTGYSDLKGALIDNFGGGTANRALEHVHRFSNELVASHPNSPSAEICLRLTYIAASISAIAIDAALSKVSFKSTDERRHAIINIIRYGDEDEARGLEKVRIATALIERYAPNGGALSQTVAQAVRKDYAKIPAEIIADHVVGNIRADGLFRIARSLDLRAFNRQLLGFDDLSQEEKAFIGVLVDFVDCDRAAVAKSWTPKPSVKPDATKSGIEVVDELGPLFDNRKGE
ncbi:hypothetical protein H9N28_03240 [Rhodobacter capsulatus]|uniref:hypothetical protein n=1 Tax=Rhodobacter capsulatus TaxID=1061 RepID=UPI000A5769BD|nr:hypothetical protein [Rhodobacter capsulatus]PZX25557.1 hypothetical protein LY44_01340 [Rhodobacter capsulatus]QNR63867.1 hypothetical protein H9N28_03240 [Rhodobacter capsulatus]